MAKEKNQNKQDENNDKKSKTKKNIASVLTPIVVLILIAACFIAIVQGILSVIVDVVKGVMDFLANPTEWIVATYKWASNGTSYLFDDESYKTPDSTEFTLILNDEAVKKIKDNLASSSIDTKAAGLTDVVLKRMILVNYMTTCTVDTEIGLPLSEEEFSQIKGELDKKHIMLKTKYEKKDGGTYPYKEYNDGIFTYWSGSRMSGGDENKWFVSVKGIVSLVDEDGNKIWSYNDEALQEMANTFEYAYNEKKNKYANAIKQSMQHSYSLVNPGTIKMIKEKTIDITNTCKYVSEEFDLGDGTREWQKEEVTLDYSQYISQYSMPMDFLVSLLELTGSVDFVDAICDIVGETKIEIVIASNEKYTVDVSTKKYKDEVTVDGIQKVETETVYQTKRDDGSTDVSTASSDAFALVSVKYGLDETVHEGEDYNFKIETKKTTSDIIYSLYIKSVETWYCSAKYDISHKVNASETIVDAERNEENIEIEYDGDDASYNSVQDLYNIHGNDEGRIWIQDEDETIEYSYVEESTRVGVNKRRDEYERALTYDKITEIKNNTSNTEDLIRINILDKVCRDKVFFDWQDLNRRANGTANSTGVYSDTVNPTGNYSITSTSKYIPSRVTKIIEEKTDIKNSEMSVSLEKVIGGESITTDYEDKTDRFLGLLKNEKGKYFKGALYKSDGKKVKYGDIYNGQSIVGDLLINGEEALYQFMESTTSYNKGLENIMKYILARYKGEIVTSSDFDSAINWLRQSSFSSIGGSSSQECLHQMMASYEGLNKTSDGTKYLLLDGYNNDEVYSISTAYGFKFYEKGYSGYEHELAMNKAYQELGYSGMTLDKAIGSLIKSDGSIDVSKNINNVYPEKYALPIDVVDKAHYIRISEEKEKVNTKLKNYNDSTGKNKSLTDQQICAIVDAGWQYGIGYYDKFMDIYFNLEDSEDISDLRMSFLPFNDSKYPGRSSARWKLFSEGIYVLNDGTILTASDVGSVSELAGKIVEEAKELVELTKMGGKEAAPYNSYRKSSTGYSSRQYVCASFVSEVLYNSTGFKNWHDAVSFLGENILSDSRFELIYYKNSGGVTGDRDEIFSEKNVDKKIEDIIQPGDVVGVNDIGGPRYSHVMIYIGSDLYAHQTTGGTGYPQISNNFFGWYANRIKYIIRYKGN